MQKSSVLMFLPLLAVLSVLQLLSSPPDHCQSARAAGMPKIVAFQARSAAIPVQVLVQSPAETTTELQIVCFSNPLRKMLCMARSSRSTRSCKVFSNKFALRRCFAEISAKLS